MKENKVKKTKGGDLSILLLTAILVAFGTVMIFSASYYPSEENGGDPYYFLKKQLMWVAIGTLIMIVCAKINYHLWVKFWLVAPIVCLGLLVVVLTPIGSSAYGATRWIQLGPITLMPGEISKVGIILFVTGYLSKYPKYGNKFWKGVVPVLAVAGVYFILIMRQPNMSTAVTVGLIAVGMLIVAGMTILQTTAVAVSGAALVAIYIFSDKDGYRYARFTSFLDPFADPLGNGWQVVQSLLALGTGGLTGLGLGNSIQKNLYLPMAQNDFILAIIGEELGFVGILLLVVVYVLLIWRGFHTAMNAKDYTGMMLASGIVIMLGVQVVINIAVVTSSMPPTGIVLPFISYGGNALLIFMAGMGIVYNISKSADI